MIFGTSTCELFVCFVPCESSVPQIKTENVIFLTVKWDLNERIFNHALLEI